MSRDVAAIVPAAGEGRRLAGPRSKLFLTLNGEPLLAHTLRALQGSPAIRWIIPVVRSHERPQVEALIDRYRLTKALGPRLGGASRAESVANGVAALPREATWVLVHDGARPCVSAALIQASVRAAKRQGAVTCGLPASVTVKAADERREVRLTLDRDQLWFVQTPQVFRRDWFVEALTRADHQRSGFPDDAALMESAGFHVWMVPGDPLNIKVTTPEDVILAEAILKSRTRSEAGRWKLEAGKKRVALV